MEKEVVYIAGKITGDPDYREKFKKAQEELEKEGYIVLNPAILPEGFTWEAYMNMTEPMLKESDRVCFLPDWKDSKGARAEFGTAVAFEKDIFFFEDFLNAIKCRTNANSVCEAEVCSV